MVKQNKVSDIMTSNPITVGSGDRVSDIIGKFEKFNIHEVVVVDGKRIKGMVSHKELMTKKVADPSSIKAAKVMVHSPTVKGDENVLDAALLMVNNNLRALPVVVGTRLVGLLSQTDLVDKVCEFSGTVKVSDLMTPFEEKIRETDKFHRVQELMRKYDTHRLPVVNQNNKLVGVIGTLSILKSLGKDRSSSRFGLIKGRKTGWDDLAVSGIIQPPFSVHASDPVKEAVDIMKDKNVSIVVVVDETNTPLGFISQGDIISGFIRGLEKEKVLVEILGAEELEDEILELLYKLVTVKVRKLNRDYSSVQGAKIVMKKTHGRTGKRVNYEFNVKLVVDGQNKIIKKTGWNPVRTLKDALDELDRKITRERERKLERVRFH